MNSGKGQTAGTEMYDRIDRYILGMMDHDESVAFEDEMSSDAALADNVSVRRMIIGEVQRREALRDDFMAIETAHPYRNSMSEEPVTVDVNGNGKCTDFGNRECSDFGNNNAPISVTTIHNFR